MDGQEGVGGREGVVALVNGRGDHQPVVLAPDPRAERLAGGDHAGETGRSSPPPGSGLRPASSPTPIAWSPTAVTSCRTCWSTRATWTATSHAGSATMYCNEPRRRPPCPNAIRTSLSPRSSRRCSIADRPESSDEHLVVVGAAHVLCAVAADCDDPGRSRGTRTTGGGGRRRDRGQYQCHRGDGELPDLHVCCQLSSLRSTLSFGVPCRASSPPAGSLMRSP